MHCLKYHFNFLNSPLFLFRLTLGMQDLISSFAYATDDFWHSKVFQGCVNTEIVTPLRKQKPFLRTYLHCKPVFLKLGAFFFSRWERSAVRFTVLVQSTTFLLLLYWLGKLAEHTYFCISKGSSAPTWFMSLF